MILSTLLVFQALVLAVPLGLALGVLLAEYRAPAAVRVLAEVAGTVPSVVVATLVWLALQPLGTPPEVAVGIALAVVVLPAIALEVEGVLRTVPMPVRDAAHALGASRFQVLVRVVLPSSRGELALVAGKAAVRVVGEAAPLLVIGLSSTVAVDVMEGSVVSGLLLGAAVVALQWWRQLSRKR